MATNEDRYQNKTWDVGIRIVVWSSASFLAIIMTSVALSIMRQVLRI